MPNPKPKKINQHAPVKFGEPFHPNSAEGVQIRRRQAAAIRRSKEEEAELAKIDARQNTEDARLAVRSPLWKLWDRILGNDEESGMFGRYVWKSDKQKLAEHFRAQPNPPELPMPEVDSNVATTTHQPITRQSKETGDRERIAAR